MSVTNGEILGKATIIDRGSSTSSWDLVLLGDGYRREEIATFEHDAAAIGEAIVASKPFDEFRINVHRVDVASKESGAGDRCAGTQRATYFESEFCVANTPRLLVTNNTVALIVAADSVPAMNAVLMIVNSDRYGGSGLPEVPVVSRGAQNAWQIAVHEIGHSHFNLADEYVSFGGLFPYSEPTEPNVTTRLDSIKWSALLTPGAPIPTWRNPACGGPESSPIPAGIVGAIEGAKHYPCAIYRPQSHCRMLMANDEFCAVCQATIRHVLDPFRIGRRRSVRSR